MSNPNRYNIRLSDDEAKIIMMAIEKEYPFAKRATAAKMLLLQAAEIIIANSEFGTKRHQWCQKAPKGTKSVIAPKISDTSPATPKRKITKFPGPGPARAYMKYINLRDLKKEEEEKKEEIREKEKTNKREREKQEENAARLAKIALCADIIQDLNERAGTRYRPKGKRNQELIFRWINEGYTLEDFKEVHRKKCHEWKDTDMARYLAPETLYCRKFEQYLGQLDVGPKRGEPRTEAEKRAARWERQKQPGYHTSNIPEDLPDYVPV